MSVCAPRPGRDGQTSGRCPEHGMYAGGVCAECAAAAQPADDIQARLSTHHALWMAQRHDIELLQATESRQDSALTELEAAVAEINGLYDQVAELRRKVQFLTTLIKVDLAIERLDEELL